MAARGGGGGGSGGGGGGGQGGGGEGGGSGGGGGDGTAGEQMATAPRMGQRESPVRRTVTKIGSLVVKGSVALSYVAKGSSEKGSFSRGMSENELRA